MKLEVIDRIFDPEDLPLMASFDHAKQAKYEKTKLHRYYGNSRSKIHEYWFKKQGLAKSRHAREVELILMKFMPLIMDQIKALNASPMKHHHFVWERDTKLLKNWPSWFPDRINLNYLGKLLDKIEKQIKGKMMSKTLTAQWRLAKLAGKYISPAVIKQKSRDKIRKFLERYSTNTYNKFIKKHVRFSDRQKEALKFLKSKGVGTMFANRFRSARVRGLLKKRRAEKEAAAAALAKAKSQEWLHTIDEIMAAHQPPPPPDWVAEMEGLEEAMEAQAHHTPDQAPAPVLLGEETVVYHPSHGHALVPVTPKKLEFGLAEDTIPKKRKPPGS